MNTFITIFLAVCFIPILPILYFTLRNESKPKNNLILSTTLPKEAWNDERVLTITKEFLRGLNLACLLVLLLYVPAFFIPFFSVQITYVLVWLIIAMVLPYLPYCKSVQKMRVLKKENWYHPELKQVQVADTSSSFEVENNYSFVTFLLPLVVSLIPLLYPLAVPSDLSPAPVFIICGTNAISIVLFYFCYQYMFRNKSDHVNANADLSANLTRIRKYYWGKFWFIMSWFCGVFSFSALLIHNLGLFFMIAVAVLCLGTIIVTLFIEFRIRSIQQKLNQTYPSEILVDEDDFWPYGAFYYNKNDNNNLVNNRVGMGTTMNLAKPFGKWMMGISLVLVLAMPVIGIWLITEEFSDVHLTMTETELTAKHGTSSYEVNLEDIYAAALLTELPKCSRNWGTAMENILKGDFSVSGIDPHCTLCLNRDAELFLLIRTNDGEYYLFASDNDRQMEEIYQIIAK